MPFIGKLKNIFGFSDSDYEEEVNGNIPRDATVTPLKERNKPAPEPPHSPAKSESAPVEPASIPEEVPATVPDELFESVVEIFNESLPPFVRDSIDKQAQQRRIYDALSESMKQYIARLETLAQQRTEIQWQAERSRLQKEMAEVRRKSKHVEDSSAEWKEQKLSAERQKRALTERVHDLEQQIEGFAAEREQYELENKSLINKIRAMGVQGGDSEAAVELQAQLDAANARIKELEADIDTYDKRCQMADTMYNDLNHRSQSANEEISTLSEQVESLIAQLAERDKQLAAANEQLASANEQLASVNEQLAAANEEVEEARTSLNIFEESLNKFERIKETKDGRIAELQSALSAKDAEIAERDDKIESLRSTIENNLRRHAESEAMLRMEIDNMKKVAAETPRRGRRKEVRVADETEPQILPSAIDDTLDDTNWLVSTPPPGHNARLNNLSEDEFGYHDPRRNNPPAPPDTTQMSLF